MCETKTVYELSKELQAGLFDLYKDCGYDALCEEMVTRIAKMKSEILMAWFAEHGFEPGKAVLVEEQTESGWKVYIRENTTEEAERARTKQLPSTQKVYDLLIHLKPALHVLKTVLEVAELRLGAAKAKEMLGWIEEVEIECAKKTSHNTEV